MGQRDSFSQQGGSFSYAFGPFCQNLQKKDMNSSWCWVGTDRLNQMATDIIRQRNRPKSVGRKNVGTVTDSQ